MQHIYGYIKSTMYIGHGNKTSENINTFSRSFIKRLMYPNIDDNRMSLCSCIQRSVMCQCYISLSQKVTFSTFILRCTQCIANLDEVRRIH